MAAIKNDEEILAQRKNDTEITKSMKDLASKATAVGVPLAAIYLSGSVMGVSAAGITSGLAWLGMGGVLGFSSMFTGIGVAVLLGVGTYKGVKKITGLSDLENNKQREMMLQAIIRNSQRSLLAQRKQMESAERQLVEASQAISNLGVLNDDNLSELDKLLMQAEMLCSAQGIDTAQMSEKHIEMGDKLVELSEEEKADIKVPAFEELVTIAIDIVGSVGGVIEVDEAFFRESFKGNHKKSTTFTIPRNAHMRGVKGSKSSKTEKRKRGISKEQVCVLCAMDRVGNIVTELLCKGRMKHTDLERLFRDRIDDESIFCTDSHKSYIQFAQNLGIELQQIKRGKHKEGIYHIQHINAFHSKLKKWMDNFNGVATKYLANYMYWFKWLEVFNTEKDTVKSKNLLIKSHTCHSDTKLKDFRFRKAIYV